jgi:hypothetical protein
MRSGKSFVLPEVEYEGELTVRDENGVEVVITPSLAAASKDMLRFTELVSMVCQSTLRLNKASQDVLCKWAEKILKQVGEEDPD